MKSKSFWGFLINPFTRIAGWPALLIGLAVMALTAVAGKITGVAFVGALNVNPWIESGFGAHFAMQAVYLLLLFLTMWLAGVCFSKSRLRAIDVAGTMALSLAPMLLFTVICFLPVVPASLYDMPRMIIFLLICIPIIIWMIALMYNAYTVSCHLKGARAVVSFIGALLVAETASKLVIIFLLGSFFINTPASGAPRGDSAGNTVVVADSLSIRQKTENVVKAFERGDFDAITVYFDATMKKGLSSGGLKLAWTQTSLTCGKFEKADLEGLTEKRINQYDVMEVPFLFRKGKRNLRLAFNDKGEISGLFFLPVN